MPTIKSSADLRNHYNDISEFCHTYAEPVFITKNGKGDLAVMSIEVYEQMMGRLELYNKLQAGLEDVREGRTVPAEDVMSEIRKGRQRGVSRFISPGRRQQTWKKPLTILITCFSIRMHQSTCWSSWKKNC